MNDMLPNAFGSASLASALLGVSKPSLSPLRSVAFLALPSGSIDYEPLYELISISSLGTAFTPEIEIIEDRYFHHTELSPVIAMAPGAEIRASNLSPSGHRQRELEWRRTHGERLRAFSGQWIVLEGEEIVAHGRDPVQLVSEAWRKGIRVPYIFFVEVQTEEIVRIGL